MKRLMHIIATPRGGESRTLKISNVFLNAFRESHPGWSVDTLDLSREDLPSLTAKRLDGKYQLLGGKNLTGELKEAWGEIVAQIRRFLAADAYLVSVPMWNFSVPHMLKRYIDVIVQPKFLFRYTDTGVEGLVQGKRMVVIATRGGDYSSPAARRMDFQEPYLRAVFGFVGITEMQFIIAQPMDMGAELQAAKIEAAQRAAKAVAAGL